MSVYSNPELCIKSKTVHVMRQTLTESASSEKSATTHRVLRANFYTSPRALGAYDVSCTSALASYVTARPVRRQDGSSKPRTAETKLRPLEARCNVNCAGKLFVRAHGNKQAERRRTLSKPKANPYASLPEGDCPSPHCPPRRSLKRPRGPRSSLA